MPNVKRSFTQKGWRKIRLDYTIIKYRSCIKFGFHVPSIDRVSMAVNTSNMKTANHINAMPVQQTRVLQILKDKWIFTKPRMDLKSPKCSLKRRNFMRLVVALASAMKIQYLQIVPQCSRNFAFVQLPRHAKLPTALFHTQQALLKWYRQFRLWLWNWDKNKQKLTKSGIISQSVFNSSLGMSRDLNFHKQSMSLSALRNGLCQVYVEPNKIDPKNWQMKGKLIPSC